ncbi:MAG: hypothetical protein ACI865_000202 [Flavobacteriaceae bacterium]|jgi:hypothetical protein
MKKQLLAIFIGATSLMWTNDALAYLGPNDKSVNNGGTQDPVSQSKGANCAPATAKLIMEFNDVSALIEQGGSLFQNRSASPPVAAYEVPRGSGLTAIYAGALWMGGTDVNGQLKLAALRYRSGNDFWPGPLSGDAGSGNYNPSNPVGDDAVRDFGEANIDPDQCLAFDQFYTIRKAEVIRYTIWWNCQTPGTEGCDEVVDPTADELNRINNWPAHGDVSLGQDYWLAPFYDNDNNGNYDPGAGDTPWYDDILSRDDIQCGIDRRISLFGDETHWWVFNDKGNIHTETQGDPIGMEIRAQAFAFATNDEVNRMTFFNYELINRGTQTLFNTYFSQYLDPDIGNYTDDYVGCDVSRGLGYCFNGDNFDEDNAGRIGYHENPPAIGVDFFEGPYQDADDRDNVGPFTDDDGVTTTPTVVEAINDNGIVYGGVGIGYGDSIIDNERFGMRRFTFYTSSSAYPYNDPGTAAEYYNFMSGFWANGEQTVFGGLGNFSSPGATGIGSDYMFPGDSDPLFWATNGVDPGFEWDESTNNNPSGDRRFVQSAGPFTLTPGAVNNITVGIVFGRGTDGSLFASVDAMKRADTKAQALFDACFAILSPPDAPKLTIQELENQLVLTLENPITSNNKLEEYYEEDKINITDPTVDRFYTFEGYQIYQMVSEDVGVSDITDATKARLVAQCDVENDIERIINFNFDEALGFAIPVEMVAGENNGIRHSFLMTEDAFAQGDRALINHITYHYIAVAYAHNEFKEYDPTDPLLLDGQTMPYISSRLSFDGTAIKSVAAVPHNPNPEAGGTIQNVPYGASPIITRLDGYGNGNQNLELTSASLNTIVSTGYMATPSYTYGNGPINIKVVDPLNVSGGYYECKFVDYTVGSNNSSNGADTASWVIYQYASEGSGVILDSVHSDFSIDFDNEQIIAKWGVSVQIHQELYFLPEGASGGKEARTTSVIGASVVYADSSKLWLSGVADNDAIYPTNWVRSGDYDPEDDPLELAYECQPAFADYLNPCNYEDNIGADTEKSFAKILDGTVAPSKLAGYQADYMPIAHYNTTDGLSKSFRNRSSISYLPSVDIVITSDKSKWTRCPVIELGRDPALNVGNADPGEFRQSSSLDINGNTEAGTGMSWFPGYAVDLESGARLYMAFGENSFLGGENGADMLWNPTERTVDGVGTPIMGGVQPVYVMSYQNSSINNDPLASDYNQYIPSVAGVDAGNDMYNDMTSFLASNSVSEKRAFYSSISWVAYPLLEAGHTMLETDVILKLRVNKEYKNFSASGQNGGAPMYSWNMDDIATEVGSDTQLTSVLDIINVVPNPYYAYSQYERNRLDTRVKITNLPELCTIKIYSVNGKLIRTFKKDSPITSIDWDLNNHKGIPIAGGVYLIHVDVPDIGERIVKFFGGMRQVDLQGI